MKIGRNRLGSDLQGLPEKPFCPSKLRGKVFLRPSLPDPTYAITFGIALCLMLLLLYKKTRQLSRLGTALHEEVAFVTSTISQHLQQQKIYIISRKQILQFWNYKVSAHRESNMYPEISFCTSSITTHMESSASSKFRDASSSASSELNFHQSMF